MRCNFGIYVVFCGVFYFRFFGICCILNFYLRYKIVMCIKYVNFINIIIIIYLFDVIRFVNIILFFCGIIFIYNYIIVLDNYFCKFNILLF